MNIRPFKSSDITELKQMCREFDEYTENNILHEPLKTLVKNKEGLLDEEIEKYVQDKEMIILLAESDGKILGFIGGKIKNYEHKVFDREGYIEDLFVREGNRGQNIARKLFDGLVEEFKKQGCNRLGIDAFVANEKALSIYRHWGFIDKTIVLIRKI